MTHRLLTTALCTLAGTMLAGAQVPGLINYQGRLTDANGAPVTGSKNFTISIYDAATGGNLLYTESIGAVTLDDNGVYSFQFGSAGTSNSQVSETVATTNGTSTTFQKVLGNSPVVAGSVSVTDGTYTWSQSAGSSNEDDFGVAYSTSLRRITVNYYNGAPAADKTISATYRYGTSGITGALSGGAEHWIAVSVDGTAQGVRQRVLAAPFAVKSAKADLATRLAPSINTCQIVVMTPTNPTNPNTSRRNLPASISPYNGYNGAGDSFYKTIEPERKIIHSIQSKITVSTTTPLFYPPNATIELAAYSNTGARTVISSESLSSSGQIDIRGPIILDQSTHQYIIECSIGTGANSNGTSSNTTTMGPLKIQYEN